ncbi:MAG: protein translocase subunit SecD [Pirellulales bacterium]|nr:protein translocase subunit SecD [Pirellulales bacterium]
MFAGFTRRVYATYGVLAVLIAGWLWLAEPGRDDVLVASRTAAAQSVAGEEDEANEATAAVDAGSDVADATDNAQPANGTEPGDDSEQVGPGDGSDQPQRGDATEPSDQPAGADQPQSSGEAEPADVAEPADLGGASDQPEPDGGVGQAADAEGGSKESKADNQRDLGAAEADEAASSGAEEGTAAAEEGDPAGSGAAASGNKAAGGAGKGKGAKTAKSRQGSGGQAGDTGSGSEQGGGGAAAEARPAVSAGDEDQALITLPGYANALVFLGVCVGSLLAGSYLSRLCRMPERGWTFALVTFALLASIAITVLKWPPKFGIDLKGGVILVYELDSTVDTSQFSMEELITRVTRRINPDGTKEITVRPYGERQIEIIIPNATGAELEKIKSIISTSGVLSFRILANRRDHRQLVEAALASDEREITEPVADPAEAVSANARQISERMRTVFERATFYLESRRGELLAITAAWVASDAVPQQAVAVPGEPEAVTRQQAGRQEKLVVESVRRVLGRWVPVVPKEADAYRPGSDLVTRGQLATRVTRRGRVEVLLYMDDRCNVSGEYLVRARPSTDPENNSPAVSFTFNAAGGTLFGSLTGANRPDPAQNFRRHLGIILDGYLQSAPTINSRITTNGIITGSFTKAETEALAAVLTAGSLPATLRKEPSSSLVTGATLGRDTIRKGQMSMLVSVLLVVAFMISYYRFAGVVANFAVVFNVLLIVAFMILFKAAFTLAGLAGLALTVGMAVDANVLIYERMREELARGAALRMAIRNGFERATTTIVDANVTTLISAVVLYVIGTDQVKGFAVTLILGILMNLFTAITVSRLIFEAAERTRLIKRLRMLKILANPNFDFIGKRYIAVTASVLLIAAGLAGVVARGKGLFDIDFTGGVSVEMLFEQPGQNIEAIRRAVAELPDVTVQDVQISVTDEQGRREEHGKRFVINTSEPDIDKVQRELKRIFGDKLATNHFVSPPRVEPLGAERSGSQAETESAARSRAQLVLVEPIDHDSLKQILEGALAADPQWASATFELDNPAYEEGSDKAFREWSLSAALPVEQAEKLLAAVDRQLRANPFFPSSNKIGASVAGKTQVQATTALLASLVLILAYVWFRFHEISFGFAAVVALIHDVLVALGALALSKFLADLAGPVAGALLVDPFKINLTIIAAFLTIIGYSLNDTIVIFDRIRELRGKSTALSPELVNTCINQTLSRTILTALTVFIVVLVLYIFGGQGIHGFAFTMVVGTISGTYSTVYIATPVVLWLNRGRSKGKLSTPAVGAMVPAAKAAR